MAELVEALIWVGWGAVCFMSGAYLLGPAVYGRELRRELRRHPLDPATSRPIEHDEVRRRLEDFEKGIHVDPRQ